MEEEDYGEFEVNNLFIVELQGDDGLAGPLCRIDLGIEEHRGDIELQIGSDGVLMAWLGRCDGNQGKRIVKVYEVDDLKPFNDKFETYRTTNLFEFASRYLDSLSLDGMTGDEILGLKMHYRIVDGDTFFVAD